MVLRVSVTLAALLGLAACGLAPNVQVGEAESSLVAELGPPTGTVTRGNTQIVTYQLRQTAILPPSGPTPWDSPYSSYVIPAPPGSNSLPPELVTTGLCTLRFRIVDGRVQSWEHSGNGC